jgi:fibronectin-binding autotransporter adhesin
MSIQSTGLQTAGKTKLLLAAVMAAGAALTLGSTAAMALPSAYVWSGSGGTSGNEFTVPGNWYANNTSVAGYTAKGPLLTPKGGTPTASGLPIVFDPASGGYTTAVDNAGNGLNPGSFVFASGAPAMTIEGTTGTNGTNAVQLLGGGNSLTNESTNTQTFASGLQVTFFDFLKPSSTNADVTVTGNFNFDGGIGFSNAETKGGTNPYPPNLTFAAGSTTTVSGLISGGAANSYGNITADGTSLQLSDANTYFGTTTLNAGVLDLENGNKGSATGTGAVTLNAGTLTGNGTSTGGTTIASNGVTLLPTGTLNVGNLDFSNHAATLDFTLGTSSSLIKTSALTLANSSSVNVTAGANFGVGTYQLIDYTSLANASDLSTWTLGTVPSGFNYQLINDSTSSSINLVVSATPEPASVGLLGLGAVGLLLVRRRKA